MTRLGRFRGGELRPPTRVFILQRGKAKLMLAMMTNEPIGFGAAVSGERSYPQSGNGHTRTAEVRFDRRELDRILNLYGRMVAAGEWRDYAIDFLSDAAVFSVFRRTSEVPLYRIEKRPRLKDRQGEYAVIAPQGLVMKRGHELAQVLRVLEKKLIKALAAE